MIDKNLFHFPLYKACTEELGLDIFCVPDRLVGYISNLKNNKKFFFKNCSLDINSLGASKISKDKDLTIYFLNKNNIKTTTGFVYSKKIGVMTDNQLSFCFNNFPLIIKPNSLSQSKGLSVVNSKQELTSAIENALILDSNIRIEKKIEGVHVCVCVYNNNFYFAYEKTPPSSGEVVSDMTNSFSVEYKNICIKAVSCIGLKLATVDCIISNDELTIIEINSSPGFSKFGSLNSESFLIVKNLHKDILKDFFT